jgi:hypothetical protein
MSEPIKMSPCPFCGGPPCVTAKNCETGEVATFDHRRPDDSDEGYAAHVWCHDCGAQGPDVDSFELFVFQDLDGLEVADLMRIAVERWNDRHAMARDLYDSGDKEGLNMFPRDQA